MAQDKILGLNNLGLCIKSKDTTIEYQNSKCVEICGNQLAKKCDKGCVLKLNADRSDCALRSGFKLFRNMSVDNAQVESVIAQDGEKIITLLMCSHEIIQQQLNLIQQYNLSSTELNIIKKFIQGCTNKAIAAQLFISRSTLRTHLNNIYKKIPANLKEDILAWHFKK